MNDQGPPDSSEKEPRDELAELADRLGAAEVARLIEIGIAMTVPIDERIGVAGDLLRPNFVAEFRTRLQVHHATQDSPLDRLGFENAFVAASRAAGLDAAEAPSRTTRFYDVTVAGERFALKTEAAKALKPNRLHISKLSEAAWIQDMRSARVRFERTMTFFDEFLAAVDRIFVLRFYRASPTPHYELVEIPIAHFERVKDLSISDFDSDSPRIPISDDSGPIMELHLDRSDSKITIGKIEKSRCIMRAEWKLG